jgi:hypothetical protein
MTYIYLKKDLTFIADPAAQTLIKAFLKALYADEYITECEEEFGFVRVTGELRDQALAAIDALVTSDGAPEWTFEVETEVGTGQGDYVISAKRASYSEVEQDHLVEVVAALQAEVDILKEQNALLMGQLGEGHSHTIEDFSGSLSFINDSIDEDTQVKASLVMSSISMVLWIVAVIVMLARFVTGRSSTTPPLDMNEAAKESGEVH